MRDRLSKLTLADVNSAIKRYLAPGNMRVVVITKDAEALRDAILKGSPSPIKYNSPKPDDITAEDKIIETYKVPVAPAQVSVVPAEQVFQ
jgi:zinc protease